MRVGRRPELSIVVVAYKMSRELPRTLRSLARDYQRGTDDIDYEVLVVDNGSPDPVPPSIFDGLDGRFRVHRIDDASPSPVVAANHGISMTRGRNVGLILDGARMVTPGAVASGVAATRTHERPIVTALAWHLGPDHQARSVLKGYGPTAEDALLEQIGWPTDNGYRLFDIAALAMANPAGFGGPVNESCFLILPRQLWDEIGGLDERFDAPGGGFASLDLFARLVALPHSQLVVLLGEGSFHQVHGGASMTANRQVEQKRWTEQYQAIRGLKYTRPIVDAIYYGRLPDASRRWVAGPE